ncbi:MAG: type II secretion system F family protein [Phycisphaerae bacterium]|nr:type II secretion system F family protein [Phycisphaerae bacterium]
MPTYHYTAIAANGKKVKGNIAAESPFAARRQLRLRNIHPSSVDEVASVKKTETWSLSSLQGVNKAQIVDFTKQMATLLNSGIKLTEALSVLTMQVSDVKFRHAINDIRDRVMTGESLADAMKDYDRYFDVIFVSMIRVGEVTGNLGGSLKTMATFMEKRHRVESKIVTAMVYPMVLIFFCLAAIMILTTKVIPTIGEQIINAGQELPWITQQLMNFSAVLTSWKIFVLLGAIGAIVFFVKQFFATDRGAYFRDKTILSLPLFGPLIKQRVVSRFAATLSTLLGSGLAMAESLRIVAETTGNVLMKKAVKQARERIMSGADIASPLRDSGVISPAIAHMVAVGEKSGELETMLQNISSELEESTDMVIERLSAAVEPVIIVFMAGVIGIIAYATIMPILRISSVQF